jgi:hypothetical protein
VRTAQRRELTRMRLVDIETRAELPTRPASTDVRAASTIREQRVVATRSDMHHGQVAPWAAAKRRGGGAVGEVAAARLAVGRSPEGAYAAAGE